MSMQADQETAARRCCDEPDCTRKEPIHLYLATLHNRVYVVTAARKEKSLGNGKARFKAVHRHEITEQMANFVRQNEEWVRAILYSSDAPRPVVVK